MDKLLQWSIAQQSGDQEAIEKIGKPDPKMLEQLFGGPDEPALMKQAIMVIDNEEATLENKEIAFDNFEMLIENMDNANNIENIKLWSSVIDKMSPKTPTSLRVYAASCAGIAVQNNPKSQEDFLKYDGLEQLINICNEEGVPTELRLKPLFAISSLIRNFESGYAKFDELDGWSVVKFKESDDHKIKLRILSLVSAILSTPLDKKKEEHVHKENLVANIITLLQKDGHIGCIDKALNIISQLASSKFEFSSSEIGAIAQGLEEIEQLKDRISEDDYNSVKQVVN